MCNLLANGVYYLEIYYEHSPLWHFSTQDAAPTPKAGKSASHYADNWVCVNIYVA